MRIEHAEERRCEQIVIPRDHERIVAIRLKADGIGRVRDFFRHVFVCVIFPLRSDEPVDGSDHGFFLEAGAFCTKAMYGSSATAQRNLFKQA